MISPRYATMFCFVQTDAALEPRHARPAHRRVRAALVRPHQRGRPALDERHGGGARERRLGRPGRAGVGRRARARRGARRPAAPARARDRARRRGREARGPRGRERPPGRGGAGGALDRQLAAREDRAPRRRPQLRPHPPGGRPGLAARRAVRGRPRDRGPPGGLRRRRGRARAGRAGAAAREIEYVLTMPGEGGETEVFFSDLSPDYVNYNADYTS